MGEFLKRLFSRTATLWARWSMVQRGMLVVVIAIVIGGLIALARVSSAPIMVSVIDAPINDEEARYRIMTRINEENVRATVTANGLIQVQDEATAKRMRTILIREDLIPKGVDPWQIFDKERWTLTDMERNVNFQRAQQKMITEHIKAIDDVDDVSLTIVWPSRALLLADQNPASASVVVTPKPGSRLAEPENRKQVEGIQRLLKYAIEGLKDENILIVDKFTGLQLNDFEGMRDFDRQSLIEREQKFILAQEAKYRGLVLGALQKTFSPNRVRDLNIKIDMDMSKETFDKDQIDPIMVKQPTPGLAYDDSERIMKLERSQSISETKWEGTGANPEGPPGVEPNVMPAFKDMSNLYGRMTQETNNTNYEMNLTRIKGDKSPQIDRMTISVNIDGVWKMKYDEKKNPVIMNDGSIEREYTPVLPEHLKDAEALIQDAIGFDSARRYSVTVTNIPFDRTEEFKAEDDAYFRKKQIQTTVIVFLSGLTLLLFGFIMFRMISREMERRRRLAEEERARREQMLRESAMAEAEQEGMDVSISLEERNRMELMESAINLAKEHPEDAAQLIRTWLLEE